jgi:clathrin heavy chain
VERTHAGIFTQLGILYSKFKPEKLLEHIKIYYKKMNLPQVIAVAEQNLQWVEVVLLYFYYEEYDYATIRILDHIDAWNHNQLKDIIVKVTNLELLYRAIQVYLEQHPTQLNDLLSAITARVDPGRVVLLLRRLNNLHVIKPWLLVVQAHVEPRLKKKLFFIGLCLF